MVMLLAFSFSRRRSVTHAHLEELGSPVEPRCSATTSPPVLAQAFSRLWFAE